MDQERFDHLTRRLVSGTTRRGMVRQLTGTALGGVLAAVGISEVGAKKKKHGHGKGKASSAAQDKVAVCHYDTDADTYVLINVSQSGWDNGHSKHKKDFQQADKDGCCLDRECAKLTDTCHVGKCVVNEQRKGACQAVATPGAPCGTDNLCVRRRMCQADGTCGGGHVIPCEEHVCHTVQCNPATGCEYTPSPDVACDSGSGPGSGTCNASGECVCKPKTCADLGRVCGSTSDGCGGTLECGSVEDKCGNDIENNCCGGRCCRAAFTSCGSNAECCNGVCNIIAFGRGLCSTNTDYICPE
jgi:hypothetical protein